MYRHSFSSSSSSRETAPALVPFPSREHSRPPRRLFRRTSRSKTSFWSFSHLLWSRLARSRDYDDEVCSDSSRKDTTVKKVSSNALVFERCRWLSRRASSSSSSSSPWYSSSSFDSFWDQPLSLSLSLESNLLRATFRAFRSLYHHHVVQFLSFVFVCFHHNSAP